MQRRSQEQPRWRSFLVQAPHADLNWLRQQKPDLTIPHDESTARRRHWSESEFENLMLAGTDIEGSLFEHTALIRVEMDRSSLADTYIVSCDWANLNGINSSLIRCNIANSRLTGLGWASGTIRDVSFVDCKVPLSSFRYSKVARVTFERCDLSGAEFIGADLRRARFIGCDLSGAQFSNAEMDGCRFSDCDLYGVGGVSSMRGAFIDGSDLVSIARSLAKELGINLSETI